MTFTSTAGAVGLIGIGAMGWPMALNLHRRGLAPMVRDIEAQLRDDHYDLDELPPVANQIAAIRPDFYEVTRTRSESMDIVVFRRR